jgi:hypothetical protein
MYKKYCHNRTSIGLNYSVLSWSNITHVYSSTIDKKNSPIFLFTFLNRNPSFVGLNMRLFERNIR